MTQMNNCISAELVYELVCMPHQEPVMRMSTDAEFVRPTATFLGTKAALAAQPLLVTWIQHHFPHQTTQNLKKSWKVAI